MRCDRTSQSRSDAASSRMDDAKRTIEIERTTITKFENTELTGESHEVHRGLKGCARDERCDAVPLASILETCAKHKLRVEVNMRTAGFMGIAGSDLGRPALAGLSSLTTCISGVEETIAKAKSCDDATAQAVTSERLATTRAATSDSSTIDAVERLTRPEEGMTESWCCNTRFWCCCKRRSSAPKQFKRSSKNCIYIAHCAELVQQRQASMPEQTDAACSEKGSRLS